MARKQDEGVFMLAALDEDILTTLLNRELYGLELLNVLNKARRKQGMRDLGVGSLYPALKRMEEQKLIKGRWGEEAGDSNRRRYYTVAFDGSIALQKSRSYRQELAQRDEDWQPVPDGQPASNPTGFIFS
jgi:DNA-binding PadR family transcriptional regulator